MEQVSQTAVYQPFHVLVSGFAMDGHDELRLAAVKEAGDTLELIGTASVAHPGMAAATIYQLHVVASWRRRGIGKAIVQAACDECAKLGALVMSAIVAQDGPGVFWANLGFTPVHIEGKQVIVSRSLSER